MPTICCRSGRVANNTRLTTIELDNYCAYIHTPPDVWQFQSQLFAYALCPQIVHNLNGDKLYVIELTVQNYNELNKYIFMSCGTCFLSDCGKK